MPTPDVPETPEQDPLLTGDATETQEPAIDDVQRGLRSAQALAFIRSRRRELPPGVPDAVAILRKMRGYED